MADGVRLLEEAAGLGGFFALRTTAAVSSWQPMVGLADGSGALDVEIERTQRALAAQSGVEVDDVERRVAASIMLQGLAARMLSPAIACAALGGWVPRMQLARMWWQPDAPSPAPITLPDPHGVEGDTVEQRGQLLRLLVVDAGVSSLVTAVERDAALSPHVAWGNVASSVAGAAAMLARQRPDLSAADVAALVGQVLRHPRLADEGAYDDNGRFRRQSCCLYYRLPGGGLCGDCVLQD